MTNRQPMEALLIDPNEDDVYRFLDALESEKVANQTHTVHSGSDALDFLHRRGEYDDAPRPNLILLDFELPQMDGDELLEKLNHDLELAEMPVIVLTDSDDSETVAKSYEQHANAYVQKPVNPDEFIDTVRAIEDFWLEVVRLPPADDEGDDYL